MPSIITTKTVHTLRLGSEDNYVIIEGSRALLLSMYAVGEAVLNADYTNTKVSAIKEVRDLAISIGDNNVGLREAKYFVEAIMEDEYKNFKSSIYYLF